MPQPQLHRNWALAGAATPLGSGAALTPLEQHNGSQARTRTALISAVLRCSEPQRQPGSIPCTWRTPGDRGPACKAVLDAASPVAWRICFACRPKAQRREEAKNKGAARAPDLYRVENKSRALVFRALVLVS